MMKFQSASVKTRAPPEIASLLTDRLLVSNISSSHWTGDFVACNARKNASMCSSTLAVSADNLTI